MADARPANCRFRLQEEGKAYPRSRCTACGRSALTGLGNSCGAVRNTSPLVLSRIEELERAVRDLRREYQSPVADYALRRALRDRLFSLVSADTAKG